MSFITKLFNKEAAIHESALPQSKAISSFSRILSSDWEARIVSITPSIDNPKNATVVFRFVKDRDINAAIELEENFSEFTEERLKTYARQWIAKQDSDKEKEEILNNPGEIIGKTLDLFPAPTTDDLKAAAVREEYLNYKFLVGLLGDKLISENDSRLVAQKAKITDILATEDAKHLKSLYLTR